MTMFYPKLYIDDFQFLNQLFEEDACSSVDSWIDKGRLFIRSENNELMIRFNSFKNEIVIARVEVNKKRNGVATKTLTFLKEYAQKNNYKTILIEQAMTEEIVYFAQKNNFSEISHMPFNYELKLT